MSHSHDPPLEMLTDLAIGQSESSMSLKIICLRGSNFRELEPDEMHMMAVLISDVVLTVKVGKELGEQIKTEVGIAQGDCLSAVLFIFYLAKSLTPNRECIEHNYASVEQCGNILPEECKDHDYYRKTEIKNYFEIDPKYASG